MRVAIAGWRVARTRHRSHGGDTSYPPGQEEHNQCGRPKEWEREHRDKLRQLNREVTEFVVGHLIEDLRKRYAEMAPVVAYLDEVQTDVVENSDDFLAREEPGPDAMAEMAMRRSLAGPRSFRRYQVNVLVSIKIPSGN